MNKIKAAESAKEYIESHGIEIVNGQPYNIYDCGCIIRNDQDPQLQAYANKKKYRCCPDHEAPLMNKFKQCSCGKMFFSKRVQASESCSQCWGVNHREYKNEYKKEWLAGKTLKKKFYNKKYRDYDRVDCVHRLECLNFYGSDEYQCIPCKDCANYKSGPLVDQYSAACLGDRACVFELSL